MAKLKSGTRIYGSATVDNNLTVSGDGFFSNIALFDDNVPSHYLTITNSANLTATRTLSVNVNDADRTVSLSGNLTLANSLTTSGNFAVTLTATGTTTLTLPTSGTIATLADITAAVGLSASTTSTQSAYFGDIFLFDDSTPSHYLGITNSANLTAARTLSVNVNDADRTISLLGNLTLANSLTTSGNFALTLTTTGATNVTLPTSGTLATTGNLSQFASTTSAQLAGVISDKTGSGALVFANTPTLVTPVLGNATSTTLTVGGVALASSYNSWSQTGSGAMGIIGHNARSGASNNTVIANNSNWHGHFIRMYYSDGIAIHTTTGTVTAGDVLYDLATPANQVASAGERVRITPAGDVGIGITPTKKLHISSGDPEIILIERPTNNNSLIQYKNTGGSMYAGLGNAAAGWGIDNNNTIDTASLFFVDTSGNTNIAGNLLVSGNLTINGTTTTINSTVTTLDDPIFTLGGNTSVAETTKDRGIEFKWSGTSITLNSIICNGTGSLLVNVSSTSGYATGDIITISGATGTEQQKLNGTWVITVVNLSQFTIDISPATIPSGTLSTNLGTTVRSKNGFFGLDQSTGRFTFIPQANNASEVFSGTVGDVEIGDLYVTGGDIFSGAAVDSTLFSTTTTGNVSLANGLTTGTLRIGSANGSGAINIGNTGTAAAQTVNIATATSGTITIGGPTSLVTIATGTGTIQIGTAASAAQQILIGTGTTSTISIGGTGSPVNIATGASTGAIQIGSTTASAQNITLGGTTTGTINIGSVSGANTVNIGSTSSTAVNLPTGKTKVGQTFLLQGGAVNITLPTAAGTLVGSGDTTLPSSIVSSSLTSVGTLTGLTTSGDIAVNGGDITTTSVSASIYDTTATSVNAFRAATTLNIATTGTNPNINIATTDSTGTTTIGNNLVTRGRLQITAFKSATAWNNIGIAFDSAGGQIYTNTSVAGTYTTQVANSFNTPTFASTNAVTVTNAATLYIQNSPLAGTNTTFTDNWSIFADAGEVRFDSGIALIGGISPSRGAITTFASLPLTGGSGYTDGTYTNVPLTGGRGAGALATLVVSGGTVTSVTLTNSGSYYQLGDILSATSTVGGFGNGTGSGFTNDVGGVRSVDLQIYTSAPKIRLGSNNTNVSPGTELGSILFNCEDANNYGRGDKVRIVAAAEGVSGGGQLQIWTSQNASEPTLGFIFTGNNNFRLYNSAGTFYHEFSNVPTANRTITLPDANISFANAFTTSGAFPLTLTTTASTNVTLPTTGTLATLGGAEAFSGVKTFTAIPAFNGGTSGTSAPFAVDSTFVVTNLNADLLDGLNASQFLRSDANSVQSAGGTRYDDGVAVSFGTSNDMNISHSGINNNFNSVNGDFVFLDNGTTRVTIGRTTGNLTATGGISGNQISVNSTTISSEINARLSVGGSTSFSSFPTGLALATTSANQTYTGVATTINVPVGSVYVSAPSIVSSTNALTITNSASLYIDGPPVAGLNTTLTNKYALYIGTGPSYLQGDLTVTGVLNVLNAIDLSDNDILRLGTGDDWELFHNGTDNYMDLNVGNLLITDGTTTRFTFERTTGNLSVSGTLTPARLNCDKIVHSGVIITGGGTNAVTVNAANGQIGVFTAGANDATACTVNITNPTQGTVLKLYVRNGNTTGTKAITFQVGGLTIPAGQFSNTSPYINGGPWPANHDALVEIVFIGGAANDFAYTTIY